ncbi:MAG TPA: zinc metalloprotease [Chitinophagaceae bacterium]|nr:zinc metalloprotease [Chitinophagaceae bacterium]
MKKIVLVPFMLFVLAISCKKKDAPAPGKEIETDLAANVSLRNCFAQEMLEEQLKKFPDMRARRQSLEEATRRFVENNESARLVNGVLEIPVVVNVLYRTTAENISQAQIQSQIDVLNEDFGNTNLDRTKVPAEFLDEQATVGYRFVLAGINRKYSKNRSWSIISDDMKRSSTGGIDATDPTQNLNIWVVNKMTYYGQTILGYAQFPGGPLATDGVVIGYNYMGRTGTVTAPFNKGRTGTHEVGHWMNLYHIWGDATCGTDEVGDTPQHNTSNYGCPTYPHRSTCSGTPVEMTMNYMDYTDDACMYMFSNGQAARMNATFFAAGAPRASFAQ